jgi:NAD(P)-dependent dehydrogenase (short-subunit alcohol dehydrogenase family)
MRELQGKVALITGGASGIGLGMARAFAGAGMRLVLADIEADAAAGAAAELRARGAQVRWVRTDVTDRESVAALARGAFETEGAVHLLCNNAGVCVESPVAAGSDDDWEWLFAVNVHGARNVVRAFVPRLRAQGEPAQIVNTGSFNSLIPAGFLGIYTATKFALLGLSESLRQELAPDGIAVSTLLPLGVNTRLDQSQRNRPAGQVHNPHAMKSSETALRAGQHPDAVGEAVLRGVREGARFIFPDGSMVDLLRAQLDAITSAMEAAARAAGG